VYQDKTLNCRDCGEDFVFTAQWTRILRFQGFWKWNRPVPQLPRCQEAAAEPWLKPTPREMFKTTCAKCGQEAEVPFRPSSDRPVYCKECYPGQQITLV